MCHIHMGIAELLLSTKHVQIVTETPIYVV